MKEATWHKKKAHKAPRTLCVREKEEGEKRQKKLQDCQYIRTLGEQTVIEIGPEITHTSERKANHLPTFEEE